MRQVAEATAGAGHSPTRDIRLIAPSGFPLVQPGAALVPAILEALSREAVTPTDGDIVVLAQKVVSKSESRYVDLRDVKPSDRARELATVCGKDPRLIEVILSESRDVLRCRPGVIIVRHRLGFVLANAGVDHSNIPDSARGERVLLLPEDPDGSASRIREEIGRETGVRVGVLIIDSLGRAWRLGTCGICIGAAGIQTLQDLRGGRDLFGQELVSTIVGIGDEIAAAASLVMGQGREGLPLVLVRGLPRSGDAGAAADLIRPLDEDMFR
jgi:coenzyme F420-0:L-glutamate ligase / coenzyme F420-1:gamma-L-glutamate ligase